MLTISKRTKIILLFLILMIAVFFRFYKIAEIPPGLYPDVAMNGTNALDAIKTGDYKVFYPQNNGREGLFMNLIAVSFMIFGSSVWAIKIVAALFGIFTVFGTYLLARQLFKYLNSDSGSEIIALLSAFFVAISFWHVNFSRIGFRAIMVPFFLVWGLYFLLKATQIYELHPNDPNKKTGRLAIGYWILAGLAFGLGFHTYIAFRIAPFILAPIFIIWIIKNWPRPKLLPWIILVIFALAAAAPLLYYYAKNPADFMGRAGQVSVFASGNLVKTLVQSTIKTFGQFVVAGDYNWRHNFSGSPEIFWPLIPFFIIGIFFSIVQIFKKSNYVNRNYSLLTTHFTLLVAWGAMLLPAIATNEGLPHALRSIGAIPPSYIFTGLGGYLIISRIKNFKLLFSILIFAFCITVAYFSYKLYFVDWALNPNIKGAFTQQFLDEANYLKSLPTNIKKYVIVNENGVPVPYPDGIPMPAETIKFIDYNNPEITYLKKDQFNGLLSQNLQAPFLILPMAYDENLFSQIKQKYPAGKIENLNEFSAFKIGF